MSEAKEDQIDKTHLCTKNKPQHVHERVRAWQGELIRGQEETGKEEKEEIEKECRFQETQHRKEIKTHLTAAERENEKLKRKEEEIKKGNCRRQLFF